MEDRTEFAGAVVPVAGSGVEEQIRACVTEILQGVGAKTVVRERRRNRRYPYAYPVYLTPLDERDEPAGPTILVLGKQLSDGGLDFYYDEPIPNRRVLVSLEGHGGRSVSLILLLTWCRFTRHGWYENGGRFLKSVDKADAVGSARSA